MTDQNRLTEEVRDGRPGFASVSQPTPGRFHEVIEADETQRDVPPPGGPTEMAVRSVADGGSLEAVARYFGVSESELQHLIGNSGAQPAAEPAPAEETKIPAAEAEREPQPSTVPSPRPAAARLNPTVHTPSTAIGTERRPTPPSLMGIQDSLRLLRRRLIILVAALIVGVTAGWMTAPGQSSPATYRASHTLIYEPQGRQSYNIEQVALLATSGEVPSRVAARLQLDRREVRSAVSAVAETEVGTISVSARSATADGVVSLADVTAEELTAEITRLDRAAFDAEVGRLTETVETARKRLNAVPAKDTVEQTAARGDLQVAQKALVDYQSSAAPKSQLRTLEQATASAAGSAGVKAPDSKPVRAGLLGMMSLLAGVAGVFVLDRLDSRIRSKERAEAAFGVPVVAEVPKIAKASRGQMLAQTDPSSSFVEAYRGLRTYVALWAPEADRDDGHRVLVVTSPSPGEGKTTTTAHLAAMLAEIGRTVVVVSADLRRPTLHDYFDLPAGPGLVEALAAQSSAPMFSGLDRPTSVRGVRIVPSGAPLENPAPLFEYAGDLLESVRGLADFVLIDAPPLLVANDAVEMARYADGVLMVARAGETAIEAAERSAEILERLAIPVVGTVLVASEAASSASRHYASHYYSEPERTGRRRRRPSAPARDQVPPPASNR